MYLVAEQKCPYCHKSLPKEPKKGALCGGCKKSFRVVTRPSDKQKVIVKEEEYAGFQFYKNLIRFYPTEKDFYKSIDSTTRELRSKFGREPQEADVLWGVANHLLQEKMKSGDLDILQQVYFEMAFYLHQKGKPNFSIQKASQEMLLRYYKKINYCKKVEILATDESCDVCKMQEKKTFTIEEALKKMPLPAKCKLKINKKAPDGWCRCTYLPVLD